ncbi:MAG: sulfite exporter TauE/SafE family protein [Kistimonas sp.]|nr:sulfite exporter TauE/SafE family protein [Kistimonas sp.]
MDLLLYVLAGAGVGLIVGLTGVGGGSLMTPLLLLLGCPVGTAVGTDLVYASITKLSALVAHQRQGTVRWGVAFLLSSGSIPSALLSVWWLHQRMQTQGGGFPAHLVTSILGSGLILAAVGLLLRAFFCRGVNDELVEHGGTEDRIAPLSRLGIVVVGLVLGCLVTLSSVGAGACGTAALLVLCPRLPLVRIVGTELAHAVPLALVAGCGHLLLGNVDFLLLCCLSLASLPATQIGARIGRKMPDAVLQRILGCLLLGLGIRYAFF